MIFTTPFLLVALAALPILYWLLRVTPPSPRTQVFPAIRLLGGLRGQEETAARTPWWLLALRLTAAGLLVIGLAGPVRDFGTGLPGAGPLLLVLDDGWAAAPSWPARIEAAEAALDRAERLSRPAALLTTARSEQDQPPALTPIMPAHDLRARVAAIRPKPWSADRAAAASAVKDFKGGVLYLSDGLAAVGDTAFGDALAAIGPVSEIAAPGQARLMLQPRVEADRLVARVALQPAPASSELAVLAQSGDGRTLARVTARAASEADNVELPIDLPPELRNRLTRLVLDGPASAGSVMLLDEGSRRHPVGLVSAEAGAETPLVGGLFYLDRALTPFTELRRGDIAALLSREISVIVLADRQLTPGEQAGLLKWVEGGGLLLRFAGPRSAEAAEDAETDPLLPERLLTEDRRLGGALSWSQPAKLAPFTANSPFTGLSAPEEVTVSRQVLAEPSAKLADHTWARLADGTPLVTEAVRGAGRVVLFHITANADWSNLPLSGLFVDMLRRLVALASGVSTTPGAAEIAPFETLDGFGVLGAPPPAATGVSGLEIGTASVSPRHPPGLYGSEAGRRALNLASGTPSLRAMAAVPGASTAALGSGERQFAFGPWLIAAALALLAFDLLIGLRLRGLLRAAAACACLLVARPAFAQPPSPPYQAALATRLAYVITGDAEVDATSRAGLAGLSDYVSRRTAVALAEPSGIMPGQDDLSYYPMIYWPVTAAASPAPGMVSALNGFMSHGGIVVIDTLGGASSAAALQRVAQGLAVPPLTPLTTEHVLARAFYLLSDFPGRVDGEPVWVQRDQDRSNDDVSPVVIGANDWAAAWAVDESGRNMNALDGGSRQRTLAYRFGVNLVMYALTGNYKGDQVHVPHILERLGQ